MLGLTESALNLTQKPWTASDFNPPESILTVKGMLGEEERRLLYWLAYYTGSGAIIDAGSFIGASAFCFAAGLRKNSASLPKPAIHSYDLFEASDQYVVDAITREVRSCELGGKYLDIFENQNAEHLEFIRTYSGDLCTHRWEGEPIEILFIDVAKSIDLNRHVVKEFFPALTPGRSIVIQQDFYHIWHHPIHVTMQYLGEFFEVVDPLVLEQSRVYRLKSAIPAERLERVIRYDFSYEERIALLARSAESSPSPTREMLRAIILLEAFDRKNKEIFSTRLAEFAQMQPDYRQSYELWAQQARQVVEMAKNQGLCD